MRAALFLLAAPALAKVNFVKEVKPLLELHCVRCHGPEMAAKGLRLDRRDRALRSIVPGQPEESRLYTTAKIGWMPPTPRKLSPAELATLSRWIAEGAKWPKGLLLQGLNPNLLESAAEAQPDRERQRAASTGNPAGEPQQAASTPASTVPETPELALVRRIRERILAQAALEPASAAAYREAIPGSRVAFDVVPIPAGRFRMGTPESEPGRAADEGPVHEVAVDAFWMAAREVTWDEYRLFQFKQAAEIRDGSVDAISRPSKPYVEMSFGMGTDGFPAISMTQHAANKYAQWLSALTGHFYRLPTEAEWEYACRAGSPAAYSFGSDAAPLPDYAVFRADQYAKVGSKKPNAWGLYDMHGNVMEWTLDQYDAGYYATGGNFNRATKAYPHAVRGGSWKDGPAKLRCGARVASKPAWKMSDPNLPKSVWYHTDAQWLGFRLVRPAQVPSVEEMFRAWNSGVEKDQ